MAKQPIFPPQDATFKMPFFYSSLSLLWTYYWVDAKLVTPLLKDTRLKPARFLDPEAKGMALVSLNFQNYGAHIGMAVAPTNEIEFNVHAYPEKSEKDVPVMLLAEYLRGNEQTKLIGEMRLHVPADNPIAVKAGIAVFGERKFLTTFDYLVPTPDLPEQKTWNYTVFDPKFAGDKSRAIYTLEADLSKIPFTVGNGSPLTLYSMLPGGPNRPPGGKDMDLIGSRWNMFGMYEEYLGLSKEHRAKFKFTIGKSTHPMAQDLRTVLGRSPKVVAVRIFISPPAAAENRAYYVDLGKKK
ncbi:MAG: hypothetical protein K8H89_04870 [Flavobacteriales bacterium]|jgi:hypothetical protein|nr:hypothetical protein [Flavobacteriales bacterium]MCB0758135.1 hypothetical protein [Flavobacteriales bacterium]